MNKLNISNSINIAMQSKGGGGKSVVSYLMANYLKDKLGKTMLVDTDPNNQTFTNYKALNVKSVNIIKKIGRERAIDPSQFDGFIEDFIENDGAGLVDTGSGDFIYINSYLLSNEIPELLEEVGKQLVIHVPINYGSSQTETMQCLLSICENYPDTPVLVWGNEFYERSQTPLDIKSMNKKIGGNIIGIVMIEKGEAHTHEADFKKLLTSGLIFSEVKESDQFRLLEKRRLMSLQKNIYNQLDQIFDLNAPETSEVVEG